LEKGPGGPAKADTGGGGGLRATAFSKENQRCRDRPRVVQIACPPPNGVGGSCAGFEKTREGEGQTFSATK